MERHKNLDERKQVYVAAISDGDEAVGKIPLALKEKKTAKNTIVIFSSDNGPESTGGSGTKSMGDKDAQVHGTLTTFWITCPAMTGW